MRLPENLMITKALLERFDAEATFEGGDGRYFAVMLRDNGDLLVHHPTGPGLPPPQLMWAAEILELLNRELHHDGCWVVVFTDPKPTPQQCVMTYPTKCDYGRYALMWLDQDGDVQFTQEWLQGDCDELRTFVDVVMSGVESTAQKCEGAWQTWKLMMRDVLDPQEGQLIKRAQGQRPSTARH